MHKFSPHKADRLENNERYELLKPEQTLRLFGLNEGMTFADIGAGTGFFSRAASKIVGDNGKVFAFDISDEMITAFKRFGVPENVTLIKSNESNIPLQSGSSDLTLLAFVLHESVDIQRFILESARITKANGRIAIIEWKRQDEEHGPPKDERLDLEALKFLVKDYKLLSSGDLNPSHYYCILQLN